MRDIGTRIQRYRLSRYGSPSGPILRSLRWMLPLIGLWVVYATVLSDHSLLRMSRLTRDNVVVTRKLTVAGKDLRQSERELNDPEALRREGEQRLREQSGFARRGEIVYRFSPEKPDSLRK